MLVKFYHAFLIDNISLENNFYCYIEKCEKADRYRYISFRIILRMRN